MVAENFRVSGSRKVKPTPNEEALERVYRDSI
jgi:hypothetical protein